MLMHINFQFSSRTLIKLGRTKRKFTAEMLNVALLTRKFVAGQEAGEGGQRRAGRGGQEWLLARVQHNLCIFSSKREADFLKEHCAIHRRPV